MNKRKTVLSLSFITPANLWLRVNRGWNSRTQVTQVWQARGISVGWMGNLQCQHSYSTVLNIFTQFVSNFLSIFMLIRSLQSGWNRGEGLYPFRLNVATGHEECLLTVSTPNQLLMPGTKRHWTPQAARTSRQWPHHAFVTWSVSCHESPPGCVKVFHLPIELQVPWGQGLPHIPLQLPWCTMLIFHQSDFSGESRTTGEYHRMYRAIMGEAGEVGIPNGELEDWCLTSSPEALVWMDQSKFARNRGSQVHAAAGVELWKQSW